MAGIISKPLKLLLQTKSNYLFELGFGSALVMKAIADIQCFPGKREVMSVSRLTDCKLNQCLVQDKGQS